MPALTGAAARWLKLLQFYAGMFIKTTFAFPLVTF